MDCFSDGGVDQIFDFSARETWSHLRQLPRLDFILATDLVDVQIEDVFSAVDVGVRHVDFLVKTTWSYRCGIQTVLMVCCSNNHDVFVLLEAIHLGENLIDSGSARTVFGASATRAGEKTVDFIDEDDARGMFASLFEKSSDALSSHAHKHFVEIGARTENKVAPRFTCNSSCKQSLTGAWFSKQHDTLVELCALFSVNIGLLDHPDDVNDFVLDLVDSLDVIESLADILGRLNFKLQLVAKRLLVVVHDGEIVDSAQAHS